MDECVVKQYKRANGECDIIDVPCPYEDKETCYHCLLYHAAACIIEKVREKQAAK